MTCTVKGRVAADQSHPGGRILKAVFPRVSGKETLTKGQQSTDSIAAGQDPTKGDQTVWGTYGYIREGW